MLLERAIVQLPVVTGMDKRSALDDEFVVGQRDIGFG